MSDYEEEKIEQTYIEEDDQQLAELLEQELYDLEQLKKELNTPNAKQN